MCFIYHVMFVNMYTLRKKINSFIYHPGWNQHLIWRILVIWTYSGAPRVPTWKHYDKRKNALCHAKHIQTEPIEGKLKMLNCQNAQLLFHISIHTQFALNIIGEFPNPTEHVKQLANANQRGSFMSLWPGSTLFARMYTLYTHSRVPFYQTSYDRDNQIPGAYG